MSGSMIGRTFSGRYRIVERIGIGGMAEVYRAQDTVLGRIVAVKVMLPQYAADADFTRRFRQEAASAANLQSPYIVNVYDWGQDEGTYYIVMEYVRGGDLKTAIKERGAINQRKVAEIASQSCQALSVAHGQDIVHRDVKPQNIMVQPDGNVKVMDFGIARAKNSVKTQTSSVLGTAHYISPEQAQGKELTAASDIYSLGVCMYEAITGQLPFDGPDAVSVAMKQVNEKPKPLHEIFPGVDPVLEAIVLRAMEKDPVKRFPTALDMRRVLNDYLAGRARGAAAAEAIRNGGAIPAGNANRSRANDVTRQMHPNANNTTQMIGGAVPAGMGGTGIPQTQVINPAQQIPPQQMGRQTWNAHPAQTGGMMPGVPMQPNPAMYTGSMAPVVEEPKRHGVRNFFIVLLLLAALGAGGYFGYNQFFNQPVKVPDVTGKTLDEAVVILNDEGYTLGQTDDAYSDKIEEGHVISTKPAAGTVAEKGSRVGITLSKGIEKVRVPNIIGSDESAAKKALKEAGLTGKKESSEFSDTVEKGLVIRVSPEPGETVAKGSEVKYVVSKGSNTKEVPWVTGQTQDVAYSNLTDAGFEVNVVEDYSEDVDEGYVIWQDPAGEEQVKKGTTITICVSLGAEMVDVPTVIGMTVSDARAILENAGFKVSTTKNYSGEAEVTNQSTLGEAKEGATINLTAQEPEPEPAPEPEPEPEPSSSSSSDKSSSSSKDNSSADDDDDSEDEDDDKGKSEE